MGSGLRQLGSGLRAADNNASLERDVQALRQAVETMGQEKDAHPLQSIRGLRSSADARQLIAAQPVDDALAAETRAHLHEVMRIGHHFTDQRGISAQRVRQHG